MKDMPCLRQSHHSSTEGTKGIRRESDVMDTNIESSHDHNYNFLFVIRRADHITTLEVFLFNCTNNLALRLIRFH